MIFKIKKVIPITFLSIAILLSANTVYALSSGLCDYIGGLYKYGIGVIGILAAVGIAAAGVMWVTAAGNSSKIKEAQSWIGSSLLGLALALSAFLILSTINPALVNCNTYSFASIASLGKNYSLNTSSTKGRLATNAYGFNAQKTGTLAKPGDGSGQFWCCVISGELKSADMKLDILDTISNGMGTVILGNKKIRRCGSYEIKTKDEAQKECEQFYKIHEENIIKYNNTTKIYEIHAVGLKQPPNQNVDNTAKIYAERCENNPTVKDWCKGKVGAEFCKNAGTGDTCKTDNEKQGYCKDGKCNPCKRWGDKCYINYECPNQVHKLSVRCGNDMTAWFGGQSNCETIFIKFGVGEGTCQYIGPKDAYKKTYDD